MDDTTKETDQDIQDDIIDDRDLPDTSEEEASAHEQPDPQDEISALKDQNARLMAELANTLRRFDKEKSEWTVLSLGMFIRKLLPSIDSMTKGDESMSDDQKNSEEFKGIVLAHKQLYDILKESGVEKIEAKIGDMFDHNLHEAMLQAPGAKDLILAIYEDGYTFKGTLLRPTKVQVGNGEA